ncbi:MAG: TIGR01212 family radical SAM protein [Bacteroidales bacterium]|nr:TIGR01212 family radical SAM protein [Bacteroidales bacterium]MDD3009775.1 TIGR01212 family radical SAM protein [Bacteroidales bacterium]MDD3960285.1 TIGR01212 family radical SAM protein [Bacteroidales bacterium]MDY0284766.1 TIGR01212 family radical SAM protein [Bacteroidales bacterium]HPE86376.1 TIGR01212 family radical SAM protein [Bacteroidales bacterium]
MQYPWNHNRRFNAYSEYFRTTYGSRVQKLSVDAGFSCPNRDGTLGTGGCTFCNAEAFNPSYCQPEKSIALQLAEGKEFHAARYRRATRFLAYFQPYSNTHAPLSFLEKCYREALDTPDVIGLVIGTRPDCIDEQKLDFIAELSKTCYIMLEYGIESCYNATLKRVNRCHTFEDTMYALRQTAARGINTGGHMILGLPGETTAMMLHQAEILSALPLTTVKLHQLQIFKGTTMADEYASSPDDFHIFDLQEYLYLVMNFLERLNPAIVIERVAGEVPPPFLVHPPAWNIRNDEVIRRLEMMLEENDTWQGKYYATNAYGTIH